MSQLTALALSVGVIGAIATWAFLSVGTILVWAAFISWACFFHSGGNNDALRNTIVCNIFGAFCGWVAAVLIVGIPLAEKLTLPVWAGIVVAITAFGLVMASSIKAFAAIPASVYGYAAIFAFLLQTPETLSLANLMSPSMQNGFVVVSVSMAIGAVMGLVTAKLAGALTARTSAA